MSKDTAWQQLAADKVAIPIGVDWLCPDQEKRLCESLRRGLAGEARSKCLELVIAAECEEFNAKLEKLKEEIAENG